jgi:tetratricopeptide (TPR) repeat protein
MSVDLQRLTGLMQEGNFSELERQAREILQRQPESGIAWQWLALSLSSQGKDARSALGRAVQYMPGDATAHNNLGNALARAGQFDDAIASYKRALSLRPHFYEARKNLAQALDGLGSEWAAMNRWHDAAGCHQQALDIDPLFFEAYCNLGNALRSAGQIGRALECYDRTLQIMPQFAEAHCNRAIALRLLGRGTEARAACRTALETNPRFASVFIVLGELSADSGEFAEAERYFQQALSIAPEQPEAWAGLAGLRAMTEADAAWISQAKGLTARPLPPQKLAVLEFAIGKCLDDLRDFDQAFAHFQRANEAQRRCRPPHDRQGLTRIVDSIMHGWGSGSIADARRHSNDSARPVFIVGMLRSGTTLAEQILASHPGVVGAGEMSFWSEAFAASSASDALSPQHESVLSHLADEYLGQLDRQAPNALRVVDKMPTNFAFLGLIHALFPRARIIHMQRHPLDTCLSIYFQNFDAAVSYANDLEDLEHYYQEYLRLMAYWRSTLPLEVMLEVPYEALVAEQESWSRRMIDFIGLPWDACCLDFHRLRRTVLTASKWQVRQKITRSAVGRWRNYASHLGPLQRLASVATAARLNCE